MSEEELQEETLLSHLIELRSRLLKAGSAVLLLFVILIPFADEVFNRVALPLMNQLPEGSTMIATQVASPFLTSRRSLIPVLDWIHSSDVSTIFSRSKLVNTFSGKYFAVCVINAFNYFPPKIFRWNPEYFQRIYFRHIFLQQIWNSLLI